MDNLDKVAEYIELLRSMGVEVVPPSVNESIDNFSVSDNKILFGLAAIKNVGLNFVSDIILERSRNGVFKSFVEFCNRMTAYQSLNKKAVESLIKCGAFDCFNVHRSSLIAVYEQILDSASKLNRFTTTGQISFWGADQSEEVIKIPPLPEFDVNEKLLYEKELLGVYVSAHPLDKYKSLFKGKVNIDSLKLKNILKNEDDITSSDGKEVSIAAVISSVKLINTKSNTTMAFVKAEDKYGACEIVVFPNIYKLNENMLINGTVVIIQGKISIKDENNISIIASKIIPIGSGNTLEKLYIKVTSDTKDKVLNLPNILKEYKGMVPVVLYYEEDKITKTADFDLWVKTAPGLLYELKEIFGNENVKIAKK